MSRASCSLSPRPQTQLHAALFWQGQSFEFLALIDSALMKVFLDVNVVNQLGIPVENLDQPTPCSSIAWSSLVSSS